MGGGGCMCGKIRKQENMKNENANKKAKPGRKHYQTTIILKQIEIKRIDNIKNLMRRSKIDKIEDEEESSSEH